MHDAVAPLDPEAQAAPLHQPAHGDAGLVPLAQQPRPRQLQVLGPEVPGLQLSLPLLPVPEEGRGGVPPLTPVARLVPRLAVAKDHGAGVPTKESESVVPIHAAGHGAVLALGGLAAVQHLPAAQGRLAPLAELVDLLAGDALPHRKGESQQLRELAHHAEPVVPLLEGALQNLAAPQKTGTTPPANAQGPVQRHLGLNSIVDHLHGLLGDAPVPGSVVHVDLLGELHDHAPAPPRSGGAPAPRRANRSGARGPPA